jgi:hypothetical protein
MSGMCDSATSPIKQFVRSLLQPCQPGTLLYDLDQKQLAGTAPQLAKVSSVVCFVGQSGAVCREIIPQCTCSQHAWIVYA